MVQVAYYKQSFGTREGSYARQVNRSKMTFEDALSFMGKQTGLSEADMRSVFEHFCEHLALFLPQGHAIQTPIGTFSLSVRQPQPAQGEFADTQSMTTDKVRLLLRCDQSLIDRVRTATSLKLVDAPAAAVPVILRSETTESGGYNRGLPGEVIQLVGSRLSFDPKENTAGVFFVDSAGQAVRAMVYTRMGTKAVDVKVPVLAAGEYKLEVRSNTLGKTLRVGQLTESFTVLA